MSDYTPQSIRNDIVALAKDRDSLLISLTRCPNENLTRVAEDIKFLLKTTNPTEKKKRDSKKKDTFIFDLKQNMKFNQTNGDKIISYLPTTMEDIHKVAKLHAYDNLAEIIEIHTKVVKNEFSARTLVLHEAYMRGKLYDLLKKWFDINDYKNEGFIAYCETKMKISKSKVYNYLNLVELLEEYPGLMLSGFGVTKLTQKKKIIKEESEKDEELYTLLTTSFPGIEADFLLQDCISDEDEDYDMDCTG